MKNFATGLALALLITAFSTVTLTAPTLAAPRTARKAVKPKPPVQTAIPAVFYDAEWAYGPITYYDYEAKNKEKSTIIASGSGAAKFERNGKYRMDYYIGSIGNFFKGTYKIKGDNLTTFDEKGKKIFDFKFTVGTKTKPPVLVLTILDEKGRKSIIYGLKAIEKKKN